MPLTAVADRGRLFGTSRSGRTAVRGVAALLSGLLTGVCHGFAVGILPGWTARPTPRPSRPWTA
ncbi:hypothetical protein [Actinophytocola sp.]|uniref:hypothetical protein n=1 Tax=Actinophytocola sp. TaxID=1872138 RepID=UPI002D386675|nr:hypothetical protein [Actinophytocola sp.]HYQ68273.1 hypothetical protein [Actinophytocola sp.]